MSDWIDITVPLFNGVVGWPGDPAFRAERLYDMQHGDEYHLSTISTTAHIGTHMDAPLHFVDGAVSIDEAPLSVLIGPARVIAIANPVVVTRQELEAAAIQPGERILLRTRNSDTDWTAAPFNEQYIALDTEAAVYLASVKPALVGIDYLSIANYTSAAPVHQAILGAGIWVVEGLDLSRTPPGGYELVCLPLKLRGAEGSPARAAVRPQSTPEPQKPGV